MSTQLAEPHAVQLPPTPVVSNSAVPLANSSSPPHGTYDTLPTLPTLPTFPLEAGWRTVRDPITGEFHQAPLILRNILFPTEDDIGGVDMAQSPLHNVLTGLLYTNPWC